MKRFHGKGSGALGCAGGVILAAGVLSVSGCSSLSGPTYGTGVGSETQLVSDMSNILSVGPKSKEKIDYQPRPDLVRPGGPAQTASLPAPQQKVASADNPSWPESPEARRARIRASATANQNNPFYRPEVASDEATVAAVPSGGFGAPRADDQASARNTAGSAERREEYKKRLAQTKQGDPTTRRYLSDPPLAYRQPADTAPTDDVGEDEWKKEQRLKAEAKAKSGKKSGWFDWLPGT